MGYPTAIVENRRLIEEKCQQSGAGVTGHAGRPGRWVVGR
jgi:hypothetical protein